MYINANQSIEALKSGTDQFTWNVVFYFYSAQFYALCTLTSFGDIKLNKQILFSETTQLLYIEQQQQKPFQFQKISNDFADNMSCVFRFCSFSLKILDFEILN